MATVADMSEMRVGGDGLPALEGFTFVDVTDDCILPSLKQVVPKVACLLICNIGFNVITHFWKCTDLIFHTLSAMLGTFLLSISVPDMNVMVLTAWIIALYAIVFVTTKYSRRTELIVGAICILFLLHGELFSIDKDLWMQARGIYMIGVMKIISLTADVENGLELPSIMAFLGYLWSPSNVLFGPWIPYVDYAAIHTVPNKKNGKWLLRISHTVLLALLFLTYSNCWGAYLLPDGYNRWLVAFRQAQSFRTSHYFISYLSESAMVAAGYNSKKNRNPKDESDGGAWEYPVTSPLEIEMPSSLSNVVVNWNMPMHQFLKRYIYRPFARYGPFKGILVTYFVSSLLHGFNMEIAAVLLSIGIYSYIQAKFQEKLSHLFNACLGIRPCKTCNHRYTSKDIPVCIARICLSLTTVFSLLYLGVLMDYSDYPNRRTIRQKWAELDYMGHWLMFVMYISYLVMNFLMQIVRCTRDVTQG